MEKIGLIVLMGLTLLTFSDLRSIPAHAEESALKHKETQVKQQEKDSKWEVHTGITRSWPSQKMAHLLMLTVTSTLAKATYQQHSGFP